MLSLDPTTGALDPVGCFATVPRFGCAKLSLPAGAASVALAPDGRTLAVGGYLALRTYRVAGGRVSPVPGTAGCVAVQRTTGCALLPKQGFDGFKSLAFAPDGRMLFGAGSSGFAFRVG